MIIYTDQDKERFWSHVNRGDSDSCWEWQAGKTPRGYGRTSVKGHRSLQAHRVAWEVTYGKVPNGLEVCHKCDNPPCCNPNHLFVGTHAENMRDAVNKRRFPRRPGSRSGRAKLNDEIVNDIRQRYVKGNISQRALAREYGVTQRLIWNILHKIAWIEL